MDLKKLLESIGLSPEEVKPYVEDELDEFMEAESNEDQIQEFHDIIFALKNLAYAKSGQHIEIDYSICKEKMRRRLKEAATVSQTEPEFGHQAIDQIPIGAVHIAFGNFKQPWSHFDPFKNGTEAEIAMLTHNEFEEKGEHTNHLIVTFDNVDRLQYSLLASSWNQEQDNTILCRIPDFLYDESKENLEFDKVDDMLAFQLYSAISRLNLQEESIFHFHSWESGTALESDSLQAIIDNHEKIFSPYLTVSRLNKFMQGRPDRESTLSDREMEVASKYEKKLVKMVDYTIVESEKDKEFYKEFDGAEVEKYAYSDFLNKTVEPDRVKSDTLEFVAGGRPVDEKGFIELVQQIPELSSFLEKRGFDFHLKIFCKEYDRSTGEMKKQEYVKELTDTIEDLDVENKVSVVDKVSIDVLKKEIEDSNGLIVPSLYDPYCLMPHYAMMVDRISFVSKYAGISEYIQSKDYLFDPEQKDSLIEAMKKWLDNSEDFRFENDSKSYQEVYLN